MGGDLYLYRLKDSANKVLKDGGYLDFVGENNIFDSKEEAIGKIFDLLDRDICSTCENRIFTECKKLEYKMPKVESPKPVKSAAAGKPDRGKSTLSTRKKATKKKKEKTSTRPAKKIGSASKKKK